VTRWACVIAAVSGIFLPAEVASQGIPSELVACGPVCRETLPDGLSICVDLDYVWRNLSGRATYGPLMNVGPIEISIQTNRAPESVRFPLFVEIRPNESTDRVCRFFPGLLVWQTDGIVVNCHPDSLWETSPRISLQDLFPTGTPYILQLHGFYAVDPRLESPYVSCLRVKAFPVSVEATTWTQIKRLYR